MIFNVIWTPNAERGLAQAWLDAADRESIAIVSHLLEERMARNPFSVGESRESTVSRISTAPPLGMQFDVIVDDLRIYVNKVWLVR